MLVLVEMDGIGVLYLVEMDRIGVLDLLDIDNNFRLGKMDRFGGLGFEC